MADLKSTIEGALATAGRVFGDGNQLAGKLIRNTGFTGPSYDPTPITTEYDFVGIWGEFTVAERAGGLVQDGEHRLEIGTDTLSVEPRTGDKVRVGTTEYTVGNVDVVRPGGVPLLYRVKVVT